MYNCTSLRFKVAREKFLKFRLEITRILRLLYGKMRLTENIFEAYIGGGGAAASTAPLESATVLGYCVRVPTLGQLIGASD